MMQNAIVRVVGKGTVGASVPAGVVGVGIDGGRWEGIEGGRVGNEVAVQVGSDGRQPAGEERTCGGCRPAS